MRFVAAGVGDAFSARYYSACLVVEAGDQLVLIDCPHPIQKMLFEAGASSGVDLSPDRVGAVVLTHLHADHASGLEGLAYFFRFYLHRRLRLAAHPSVLERLWSAHLAAGMDRLVIEGRPKAMQLTDYFELVELDERRPVAVGPLEVSCRLTAHHVPTTALLLSAQGRVLGHSSDTSFDEGLIEWLAAADLFVHETNFGIHTPYEKLAALPETLRKKMRLFHYPDVFALEESVIEPLRQGRVYAV